MIDPDFILDLSDFDITPRPDTIPTAFARRQPPVIEAEPIPSENGLRFYCIYCGVWHQHGRGNGHAVAHCFVDDSPYTETGYELVEVEKAPVPEKRYKAKYLRDGTLVSGYLYAQSRRK